MDQTVEILPGRKLPSLKAEFQRDGFGELYIVAEYANWIRGKGLGIRIAKISADSEVKSFNPDKTQDKITWGKGHDFHREGYKVEAYVLGNGDRFLADLLNKGELVKPPKIKLDFGSRWMVEPRDRCAYVRILYKDWHGYFVCKIKDTLGKTVETFKKTDRAGYIDWGRGSSVKPGKYIIEATIDKGIFETETAVISE